MRERLLPLAMCCAMLLSPARRPGQAAAADASARVIVKYKADSPLLRKACPILRRATADQARRWASELSVALRAAPAWPSARTWCSPAA